MHSFDEHEPTRVPNTRVVMSLEIFFPQQRSENILLLDLDVLGPEREGTVIVRRGEGSLLLSGEATHKGVVHQVKILQGDWDHQSGVRGRELEPNIAIAPDDAIRLQI
jgi:hypothetical protein